MKKFLLLAAFFAVLSVSAQEFTLTEVTSTANVPADRMNNRQGFGYSGAFIVMDKVLGQINSYNPEDGSLIGTLETGATASWPADFFSFIEGNVMDEDEGGILWLVTAKSTGILKVPFLGGEIDHDHIALFPVEGATLAPTSSTVVNPYVAADGTKHYMLWTRNAQPVDLVMNETEDGFIGTTFTLPNKGATNGCFPFTFGGKDLVIYTTLPNYGNAWAIAEKNAEEPIAVVPEIPGYVTNGFQSNWLNAELVNEHKAIIYQYFPGNYFKTYELTIPGGEEHTYAVCGAPAALFGMENDWDPAAAPEMALNEESGLYWWTSEPTYLSGNVEFKVVQDHAWDVCYPENNYVVNVEAPGEYILYVTYNPENNEVNAYLTGETQQPKVYIIGEVNGNSWATNVGVEMETEDDNIFTSIVTLDRPDRDDVQYCYFSFATKLMEAADDWNGLAPYRFGAVSEATADNPNGDFQFFPEMDGQPLQLTFNNGHAFMVPEGEYKLTVNLEDMTLIIENQATGIETLNTDVKVDNTWYNMAGQKFNGMPSVPGIYINNGKKVIIK